MNINAHTNRPLFPSGFHYRQKNIVIMIIRSQLVYFYKYYGAQHVEACGRVQSTNTLTTMSINRTQTKSAGPTKLFYSEIIR